MNNRANRAGLAAAVFLLAASLAVGGQAGAVPEGITVEPDISYREGDRKWKLDLTMPKVDGDELRPGLVMIHGGGWRGGDKKVFRGAGIRHAERGFVCISVNYRLSGKSPFPAAVEDVKCAVRWFRANAEKYRVDPDRIGGWGTSAGAHLVSMLALVPKDADMEGDGPYQDQSSHINAAVVFSGPAVLGMAIEDPDSHPAFRSFLSGPEETIMERARKASPITYVTKDAPPFLIIHGVKDDVVPVAQADAFVEKLKELEVDVTYLRVPDGDHHDRGKEAAKAAPEFLNRVLNAPETQ